VRARLAARAGSRMTRGGVLVITARRFRTQERNRTDAIDRLVELIRSAAHPPKPRRKTRTPRAAKVKRVEEAADHLAPARLGDGDDWSVSAARRGLVGAADV
jgi:ribosome-associated protein